MSMKQSSNKFKEELNREIWSTEKAGPEIVVSASACIDGF